MAILKGSRITLGLTSMAKSFINPKKIVKFKRNSFLMLGLLQEKFTPSKVLHDFSDKKLTKEQRVQKFR